MKHFISALVIIVLLSSVAFAEVHLCKWGEKPGSKTTTSVDDDDKAYYYQWTDKYGKVHITDTIGNVPEPYQDS